eukprot:c43787_g1_i1 orf=203-628(+)
MAEVNDGAGNSLQGMTNQVGVAPGFPVTTKQFSTVIQGNKTDFMLCSYDDYIFVLATQLGKMGTLLHARKDELYGAQITFNVNVLMGKHDETMLRACARQLIEHISGMGSSRSLLLSLGLKDHSMGTLKGIIETVCDNKVW